IETGQKFLVRNDAKISHNVKVDGGAENPGLNQTLPPQKDIRPQVFNPSREPIVIRCNIHPWMSAYARAFDHPYAALTVVGKGPGGASARGRSGRGPYRGPGGRSRARYTSPQSALIPPRGWGRGLSSPGRRGGVPQSLAKTLAGAATGPDIPCPAVPKPSLPP